MKSSAARLLFMVFSWIAPAGLATAIHLIPDLGFNDWLGVSIVAHFVVRGAIVIENWE